MGTTTHDSFGPRYPGIKYPRPNYEGPSGITSATIDAFGKHDIKSVSIWGHAPHYLQVSYNPSITMAIFKEVQQFIQVDLDYSTLEQQAEEFQQNLVKALDGQQELAGYVQKLEERFDTEEEARGRPEPRELMAELEAFLRDQRLPGDDEDVEEDTDS